MRALKSALSDHELIVLRVIGEWWELDLTGTDKNQAVDLLAGRLAQVDLQQEIGFLPPEEAAALQALAVQNGRMPVGSFARDYGEVRMMGPGRMEREEPWYDPANTAEALWYRGLLYRSFDPQTEDAVEYYYLPDEFLPQSLPSLQPVQIRHGDSIQPISAPAEQQTAVSDAVDDLTTLLAFSLQTLFQPETGVDLAAFLRNPDPERRSLLLMLAQEMDLLRRSNGRVRPTRAALDWLKQGRNAQLFALAEAWSNSEWNDLCHTPDLECEGEGWHNDPLLARTALLDALPRSTDWYAIEAVVQVIKQRDPDFQRPDGNYDTWYIRESGRQLYLSGFDSWDKVEGRLLPYLITGPLYWLGMVETAATPQSSYRLTETAVAWLKGQSPQPDPAQTPLVVQPDGRLLAATTTNRYQRFQAARISEAQPVAANKPYVYYLTPASLAGAREQGIQPERVLQFLADASGRSAPKGVERAILRWSEHGVEGRMETAVILRVSDATIIETLQKNPKTRDYIGEVLGENAVTIKRENWQKFRSATTQLGLLLDIDL